jgi:RNA polymerase sigma-70 factor (ECF subfamily)
VATAAGRGEHWALTQLFRAYQPMLIRYLRSQERRLADDLASEVWVAVAQRLGRFEGDELGFRRWLFTIARCRVIEHRRKAARRRTDPVSHDRFDGPDVARLAVDPALIVVDRLSSQEVIDLIVAGLTADQAEAVLLRVVAGFDVAEVARIMDRTPGSVRVLCHRALRRLAARFAEGVLAE